MPINLQRYELFKDKEIEKFILLENQGHCNYNYLVLSENKKYLIRKFKLINDRKSEFKIQKAVAKKNIGATPLLLDEQNGLIIAQYLEGKHQTKLSQQMLKKMAKVLKNLHKIKINQRKNSFKNNFKFRDKKVKKAFVILEKQKKQYALGHNDLHPQNILFHKREIKLIDWEYARNSDIYFDLVSIIIEYKLDRKDSQTFLRSYFLREKINHKKIEAFTLIYKELWKLWFLKLDKGEL
ncbi:MAG: phosphotransferase [Sulfurovaceae bacterium]|nr:phosphotransferase [Sulfurovaceae bacterium]